MMLKKEEDLDNLKPSCVQKYTYQLQGELAVHTNRTIITSSHKMLWNCYKKSDSGTSGDERRSEPNRTEY